MHKNSLAHSSIGTPSPLRALTPCGHNGFRFYFTGVTPLLFTFPSRYWFTIGDIEYLALANSSACFSQGFLSSRYSSKIARSTNRFSSTGLLPSMAALSRDILLTNIRLINLLRIAPDTTPLQPHIDSLARLMWFGLFPFRSPLLRE